MASEKQLDFIKRLANEIQSLAGNVSDEKATEVVGAMSPFVQEIGAAIAGEDIRAAKAKILIPMLMAIKEDITPVSDNARWKKIGDKWLIFGHESIMIPGETVTVKSNKGEKQIKVGRIHSVEGDKVFAHPVKEELKGEAVTVAGFYRKDEGIIEAYYTKSQQLVARTILDNGKKGEYLGKAGLVGLTDKLTLEEAKAFGRETGVCMVCGRELTNPASIEDGIGPVCSSKF